jgi:hypothetical protein
MSGPQFDAERGPAGYAKVSTAGVATALPVPAAVNGLRPRAVLLMSRAADSYWRDDGVTATVTDGFPLPANREFFYVGDLTRISIIGDALAVVHCVFYW